MRILSFFQLIKCFHADQARVLLRNLNLGLGRAPGTALATTMYCREIEIRFPLLRMRCQSAIAGLRLVVGLVTLGVAVASGQTTAGEAEGMVSPEGLRVGVSFDIPGMGYKNP